MQRAIMKFVGPSPSDAQKLSALRRYIYDSGEWNGHKPFAYDLTDPYGLKIRNKLLTTYLETRSGNCVSMPVLFVILGERIGLKMTLAVAPQHMLVKYTDAASGKTINLEATSGGWPSRDIWYRQNMSMSDEAIRNGLYMRPLSKREVRAALASVVMEDLMEKNRFAETIQVAIAILEHYPTFASALLTQGTASIRQIEAEVHAKYPNPKDMPPQVRQQYQIMIDTVSEPYRRVEALGWRETDGQPAPSRKTTPN
jgi:regulator of sirC expression with transglutaminase-like and TPR domain